MFGLLIACGPVFFYLLGGHAIADFALQSSYVSHGKRRKNEPSHWPIILLAHGLIHGTFVALITGSTLLGVCETIAHSAIDFGKSEEWYGLYADQFLHVLCKVLWLVLLIFVIM